MEIITFSEVESCESGLANRHGFVHIAFEFNDVRETAEMVKKLGGSLSGSITEKQIEGVGLITFVYARDQEGNILELQFWKYD